MNARDFAMLLSLAALWGASFLFMRIATPAVGPFVTSDLRVLLAGAVLWIYAALIKNQPKLGQYWKEYFILGLINAAIPFAFISAAEMNLNASLAAILNATTPLFTALVAWGWTKEPLNWKKVMGLLIGVAGVSILTGWSPVPIGNKIVYSVGFSLLAALSYGFGGIYASRKFKGVKPLDLAIGQQLGAGVILLPFSIATIPNKVPPAEVLYSIAGLSILCTSIAYLFYFRLINNVGAVKTLSVTFLVPIFGVIWGSIFLHESIYLNTLVGMIVIFLSITLVTNLLPLKTKNNSA
ncbi:DMT family transporter [Effusibacillus dendaii]|uniref:EamA domain-containing protein n=1 Tax=Effusibacillus dendaii TaxID=2743772 RepID=A0A7I8D7Z1_9BACL|nr:DMT family transporter [Effusibacillus dendaii]BCJ86185.1 hypothetical protein skT53_11700 [Effusibacillus dendaii]